MGEHTSSNQSSPTDSTSDLPPLEDLLREEWNSRGKHREATKKPDERRGKGEASHSSIPPLNNNNIAVAIFVPLADGRALLSPPDVVPETPPYWLEKLERLGAHEAAVRGNIEALYGLEFLRVRAEVATAYADADGLFDYFGATAAVQPIQEFALRQDLDGMIENMRKPDPTSGILNLAPNPKKDVALPNMDFDITYHPLNSPREAAANDVLRLLGAAAAELGSFDNHVQTISDGIKREMQGAAAMSMMEKQDRMDTD